MLGFDRWLEQCECITRSYIYCRARFEGAEHGRFGADDGRAVDASGIACRDGGRRIPTGEERFDRTDVVGSDRACSVEGELRVEEEDAQEEGLYACGCIAIDVVRRVECLAGDDKKTWEIRG